MICVHILKFAAAWLPSVALGLDKLMYTFCSPVSMIMTRNVHLSLLSCSLHHCVSSVCTAPPLSHGAFLIIQLSPSLPSCLLCPFTPFSHSSALPSHLKSLPVCICAYCSLSFFAVRDKVLFMN